MLEVAGAWFRFDARDVVCDVSLAVSGGEVVALVGPNGAGKTTLLRLCAGLAAPSAGTVRAFGDDPCAVPRHELARRLSFLPQEYRLAFPFSVMDVVLMGRYTHHRGLLGFESDADRAAARAAMERCDVLELADRSFDEISGGERRRALLAQAFCQGTELLLLDEPTAALDPAHAIAVMTALRAETRARAAGAVVVTHDLNLAARFADRIAVMHRGRIAAVGAPREVLAAPATAAAFSVGLHVATLPDGETTFVVPT